MKNLKGSSRHFQRKWFRSIVSHLWILTYLIAEENKRQKVISNFTSELIHFIYFSRSCVTNGEKVEGRRLMARKEAFEKMDRSVY